MKVKLLNELAIIPTRATEEAAGLDVYSAVPFDIELDSTAPTLIPLGIATEIGKGYEIQLRIRSGLAMQGVYMPNGVGTIDSDYRGEINMPLLCTPGNEVVIEAGQKIGQLVVNKVELLEPKVVKKLSPSNRGKGGFGSTGK